MKNFKKILIVTLVAALLVGVCMVAAFADDEYTGTVDELTKLVDAAEKANADAKLAAVQAVFNYLKATPVDPASEGYDALIDRTYATTLKGIEANLVFADAGTVNADAAYKGVFNAQALFAFAEKNLPEDYAGLAELKTKYDDALLKAANALLLKVDANILTTLKTATNKVAINKVRRVLVDGKPFGTVDFNDVWGTLTQYEKLQEQAVALNYANIEDSNSISDYDLPIYYPLENFENVNAGMVKESGAITGLSKWSFSLKNTKNPLGIGKEANGNQYMHVGYAPTSDSDKNTYVQMTLTEYKPDNGYVIEFDISTFDSLPTAGMKIEAGGFDMPDGRGFPPFYMVVTATGDLVMGDAPNASDQNKVTALSNAIVPGQWLHCVIVFDYSEFTYTLIVDGEKLSTTSAKYKGNAFDLSKGAIRFGSACESGSIAVDNFVLYSGKGYRNPDKFVNMTDDEKFVYYSNYLLRDSQDVNGKNYAYEIASGIVSKYWTWIDEEAKIGEYTEYAASNPELKAAVDAYVSFDFEELLAIVKADNLASFINYVTALDGIERSVDTINARTAKILEIEAFALKYADLIDKETDSDEDGLSDYDEYNRIVQNTRVERDYDANAILFIRHMTRFQSVTTLNAMQRYYERAKAYVTAEDESGRIDTLLIADPAHPDRDNFAELIAAYEVYVQAYDVIDARLKQDNSAKIINCMGFVDDFATEEEWLANYDYINKYLNLIKDTVMGRELDGGYLYDPNYDNVGESVELFGVMYSFFYRVQQEGHIKYISEIVDLISSTEAYIEKMGMVSMIDRYLASNDIDYNNEEIIELIQELETCRSELQLREEDYGRILIQNAVYFTNIIENLRTASDYTEKKAYFNSATEYYFNLDITVAGAAEAVAIYDAYAIELALIEESSLTFIEAVDYYFACETADERYAALVDCYYNAQFADTTFAGVTEALELYEEEYERYMGYVEDVNDDLVSAGGAVGSLRSNCGVNSIIAVIIKKIFGV